MNSHAGFFMAVFYGSTRIRQPHHTCANITHDLNFLLHFSVNKVQWGWGITGQKITVLGYEEFFELCSFR